MSNEMKDWLRERRILAIEQFNNICQELDVSFYFNDKEEGNIVKNGWDGYKIVPLVEDEETLGFTWSDE